VPAERPVTEESVLAEIDADRRTFDEIWRAHGRADSDYRRIDQVLQKLRRAGVIRVGPKRAWQRVPQKGGSADE